MSWNQALALAVSQEAMTRDIGDVRVLGVRIGADAPDLEAVTLSDQPFKLSSLRGKVVLLDFWATWCGPCVAELPGIRAAYEAERVAGFEVVSVSFDRDAASARRFATERGLSWTHIWAEKASKGPIAEEYGVSAIPTTFLIGRDGKVIARDLRGAALRDAIRAAVAAEK